MNKINPFFYKTLKVVSIFFLTAILLFSCTQNKIPTRETSSFNKNWKFHLGVVMEGFKKAYTDTTWRKLDLPHDWSIEGTFAEDNPATAGGGALPGGIGWYRKIFTIPSADTNKKVFVEFDGIYKDSEVWINENYLGKRPNGYISFRYDVTPFLNYGETENLIAVKVDNSDQPNSRWYSGSGIYRNVRLIKTEKLYVDHWGTFITAEDVSENSAVIKIETNIKNELNFDREISVKYIVIDNKGNSVAEGFSRSIVKNNASAKLFHDLKVENPLLWSLETPSLYKLITKVYYKEDLIDEHEAAFGIRSFRFDAEKGFFLNDKKIKIKGVCLHHDLGCLGAAVNKRAIERQLEILKNMGCNAVRTAHNPPAPELLDLCDSMGFMVMDEAFDMWQLKKVEHDYAKHWDKWHEKDLADLIRRDRNHPSIFIWSIGNEVLEQYNHEDSAGFKIAERLSEIVKEYDQSRPITAACNDASVDNPLFKSNALDIIGYNYNHEKWVEVKEKFPGRPFIATETESSLHTRGSYDMPSDSIRIWPYRWDQAFLDGNSDLTCSSYDNCRTPWGSTHEDTWKLVKNHDHISGMFTWTGFDYLGEPTPYIWPARSSYFGLIDLAGFPKDAYYFYQSEWTEKPMLHIFPHWNWTKGDSIDIWGYTNCDEVELFLNDKSLGVQKKTDDRLHVKWNVKFEKGTVKAVGRIKGKEIILKEIKTAGKPFQIKMKADRNVLAADGKDLSFITVEILDEVGTLNPLADNKIDFEINGPGTIIGVDNGLQTSHESFKTTYRKAFNGLCLVVVQASEEGGTVEVIAKSDGLIAEVIKLKSIVK